MAVLVKTPSNTAPMLRQPYTDAQAKNQLTPSVKLRNFEPTTVGSVATLPGSGSARMPSAITFTCTNAGGTPLTYVFGDPFKLIAGAVGATWTQPSTSRGGNVAAIQSSFATLPVAIGLINYEALTSAQFANALNAVQADVTGQFSQSPVNIELARRNNQQIATLQTIKFASPYVMDTTHAFTLVVNAGETVTMTFGIDAAAGR